jgi:hypothetical protein
MSVSAFISSSSATASALPESAAEPALTVNVDAEKPSAEILIAVILNDGVLIIQSAAARFSLMVTTQPAITTVGLSPTFKHLILQQSCETPDSEILYARTAIQEFIS